MTSNWNGWVAGLAGSYGASVLNMERAGIDGRPRRHLVEADAAAHLEGVLAAPQARHEVAVRVVEHVGPDAGADHRTALAGDVARMVVRLPDRKRIATVEADEVDVVVEEGLGAGGQFLADAADADHVAAAIADHGGVRAADQVIPVALPGLGVERLVVGVEALAARRRGLEHPAEVEEILLVQLQVAAREVVRRPHGERADHVLAPAAPRAAGSASDRRCPRGPARR